MLAGTVLRFAVPALRSEEFGRQGLGLKGLGLKGLGLSAIGLTIAGILASGIFGHRAHASTLDAANCLTAAEQVDAGETLSAKEKKEAHEACLRALSATGSVIQKYQFQEADFLITGKRDTF